LESNGDIYDVERLDGGDTLILDADPTGSQQKLRRVNREGKNVWERSFQGMGIRRIAAY
jgi:hypothetical protein